MSDQLDVLKRRLELLGIKRQSGVLPNFEPTKLEVALQACIDAWEGERRRMNKGQMNDAKRRALNILDDWNDVTGAVNKGSGWYWELQGVVEDAVECGAQAALGVYEPLDTEKD